MTNLKHEKTLSLANRLNELSREMTNLEIQYEKTAEEYNGIVSELWNRYPNLKDDVNLQHKVKKFKK